MKLSTLENTTEIVAGDIPTTLFITMFNNLVTMVNLLNNNSSIPSGVTGTLSGSTLTISLHTRSYADGSQVTFPSGSVTVSGACYVIRSNNTYATSTTLPVQGPVLIVGYFDGTNFTPYTG